MLGRADGTSGDVGEHPADQDAAEYVRSVNGGHETVPTVVVDGHPLTNPDPALVLDRLTVR